MQKSSENRIEKRAVIKAFALLLALLSALIPAGGCRSRGQSAAPEATALPSAEPEGTPIPVEGGTLRLAMPVNAPCSDPLEVTTEEMLYLFSLVYDNLLTVNSSGEIEPCLCESWTSEGPGVWLLKLREGVKWHSGGSLSAQDVLDTYYSLVNMEDSYYKDCAKNIISIEAVDTLNVRVKLKKPGIMGLYSLVFPIKRSVPMVGTGAYYVDTVTDDTVTLAVNESWWNKRPYFNRIVFTERDSNTTALASYEAGQLDMVPTDILTAGKYYSAGTTEVIDVMTQDMEALLFNHSRLFSDNDLRLAVAHGINRSVIITNVYMNRARVADVPFPPDNWLYDSRCDIFNFDQNTAGIYLDSAGYSIVTDDGTRFSTDGRTLSIKLLTSATTENTVRSDAASMIASQLETLGFKVELVTAPHTLGDPESEFMLALKEGDWDIALVGFNLNIANELSSYLEAGGANNFGHVVDGNLVSAMNVMSGAMTEEELRDAAYAFQSYFVESVPFMPLYFRLNSVICSSRIKNVPGAREPFLFANEMDWHFVR